MKLVPLLVCVESHLTSHSVNTMLYVDRLWYFNYIQYHKMASFFWWLGKVYQNPQIKELSMAICHDSYMEVPCSDCKTTI